MEKYIEAIDPLLVKEQNNLKLATEAYEKNEAYIRNLFHDGGSGETSEETSEATQPRVDTAGAWEVEAAIEFVVPIPLDADDHSQTWVWLSSRNQYRARIIEQLEDLKGDAIETLPYDDSESSREAKQTVTDALLVLRPGG